jgi:hypothetical protein
MECFCFSGRLCNSLVLLYLCVEMKIELRVNYFVAFFRTAMDRVIGS